MDPTEAAAALSAPATSTPPSVGDTAADVGTAPDEQNGAVPIAAAPDQGPVDTLSPAVRRLVRQYDLDITGIHGTGPSGRIRVGDVIGMLGGRAAEPPPRSAETTRTRAPDSDDGVLEPRDEEPSTDATYRDSGHTAAVTPVETGAATTTSTLFECDLGRVLSHRKRQRSNNIDLLLTSYFLVACAEASRTTAELTDGRAARFGIHLAAAEGAVHSLFVDTEDTPGSLEERLRALDAKLRAGAAGEFATANLLVHHYGASGSLIATPTPIGAGHTASVGIGRVRREIVVRTMDDGEEAPRVTARCYISLSFLPDRIALHRANQFMAHVVRILEQWPE